MFGDPNPVRAGTSLALPVDVAVPATREEVILNLDGTDYPLERDRKSVV
jgi:hypothetical protein